MDKTINGIMLLISELIEFIPDAEKQRVNDFYNRVQSVVDVEREEARLPKKDMSCEAIDWDRLMKGKKV